MENPYREMTFEQAEEHLAELFAEREDILARMGELSLEMQVNNDHRTMLLEVMGVPTIGVEER